MNLRTRGRHRRTRNQGISDQLVCQVVAVQEASQLHDQAVDPGDPTASIEYRTLRERFTAGPVVTLHRSPQAANPAHVPAWALKPGT